MTGNAGFLRPSQRLAIGCRVCYSSTGFTQDAGVAQW